MDELRTGSPYPDEPGSRDEIRPAPAAPARVATRHRAGRATPRRRQAPARVLSSPVPETSTLALPLQLAETFRVCAPTVVEAALGRLTRETCDRRLATWANNALRLADGRVDARGLENVRADRAYVLMSNHQSAYDIFSLFVAFPHSMRMVAKKAMFRLPIMGGGMRAAGFVEIDRSDHDRAMAALERAKEIMASGINVWIAPEGTRSDDGALLTFKRGGFMMAMQLGCPILPVTIDGTREILPAKDYRVRLGKTVRVTFHPAVDAAAFAPDRREALMETVRRAIASTLPAERDRAGATRGADEVDPAAGATP